MPQDGERSRSTRTIEELTEVLDHAAQLVDAISADPTIQRVLDAFRVMPLEDRAVIATALEREVQARRLSLATADVTGQSMHPNPSARLYLRAHQKAIPRMGLERDELLVSMLAAMRLTPILLDPEIHAAWLDGTRGAVEHLEPAARAAAAQLLHEMLALLAEAEAPADPLSRAS